MGTAHRLANLMSDPVLPRLCCPLVRARERLAGERRKLEETHQLLVRHAAWLQPGAWVPLPANRLFVSKWGPGVTSEPAEVRW